MEKTRLNAGTVAFVQRRLGLSGVAMSKLLYPDVSPQSARAMWVQARADRNALHIGPVALLCIEALAMEAGLTPEDLRWRMAVVPQTPIASTLRPLGGLLLDCFQIGTTDRVEWHQSMLANGLVDGTFAFQAVPLRVLVNRLKELGLPKVAFEVTALRDVGWMVAVDRFMNGRGAVGHEARLLIEDLMGGPAAFSHPELHPAQIVSAVTASLQLRGRSVDSEEKRQAKRLGELAREHTRALLRSLDAATDVSSKATR